MWHNCSKKRYTPKYSGLFKYVYEQQQQQQKRPNVHWKSCAVKTPRCLKCGHFSALCMKGLKQELCHFTQKYFIIGMIYEKSLDKFAVSTQGSLFNYSNAMRCRITCISIYSAKSYVIRSMSPKEPHCPKNLSKNPTVFKFQVK